MARIKLNRNKVFSAIGDTIPYISNIANSFRRPPMPATPRTVSPIAPTRVSFAAQMAEADRQRRGADLAASRSLDENTAAAVRASDLAQSIRAKNSIAEQEANINAGLRMQAAQVNAGIDAQNTAIMNQYKQDQVAARIAQQREQSENLANAADKYIAQRNAEAQRKLDMDRLKVYLPLWKQSGVYDRLMNEISGGSPEVPMSEAELRKAGGLDLKRNPYAVAYGGRMKAFGGPGDETEEVAPAMSDQQIYQSYLSQLKGEPDAYRKASISYLAKKYGVPTQSISTTSKYPYKATIPEYTDYTVMGKDGKVITTLRQIVGGDTGAYSAPQEFANGGSIHIKPSHRGLFTRKAKAHGEGIQEFASQVMAHKENYSPATVKQANFARNATKFKHANGGRMKAFNY